MNFSQAIPAESEAESEPLLSPMLLLRIGDVRHRVVGGAGSAVAPCARAISVPLAPPWLLGITVYEGEAVPLVDLAVALDGGVPCAPTARARMLVTHCAGCAVAYAVDEVDADDGRLHAVPLDLEGLGRALLAQVLVAWPPA